MQPENFNQLAKEIHANNVAKGFYDKPKEKGTLLMLIVSELSEALESDRKDKRTPKGINVKDFDFSKKEDVEMFLEQVKDTFEDEIADTFIRLFDLVGYLGIDIDWHIKQKLEYNKTRAKKHGKNY